MILFGRVINGLMLGLLGFLVINDSVKIKKLKELFDDGVLTQDEFDLEKQKLINSVNYKIYFTNKENSKITLPELLLDIFNAYNNNKSNVYDFTKLDMNKLYMYGTKNPESYYKSILLLTKMDFITKNKYNMTQDILNIKKEMSFNYGGKEITIETGRLAKQADGAVLVTCEDSQVLVTVCSAKSVNDGQDFFPLIVCQGKIFSIFDRKTDYVPP